MRWPLRNQILVGLALLLSVTIASITWILIQNRVAASREEEQAKIVRISKMLSEFPFPKNDAVLEAMKSLSGAEFVVAGEEGEVTSRTRNAPELKPTKIGTNDQVTTQQGIWRCATLADSGSPGSAVCVYLPVESPSEAFWRLAKVPLMVVAIAFPLAMLAGLFFSNRITRPLAELCEKSEALSSGQPVSSSFANRKDEIGDLFNTMNAMAEKIRDNEERMRRNERLSTLVEVGNGIAHNLGNSAAGCQMALELMASSQKELESSEEYQVAMRQLGLMTSYIKRFLSLSKQQSARPPTAFELIELKPLLKESIELLGPMSRHLGVKLQVLNVDQCTARVDSSDAREVMLNLISNAIRAAKERTMNSSGTQDDAAVAVSLQCDGQNSTLTIQDNGEGPAPEISKRLFEPFVSGSQDGTGLGLAMVKGVADQTGGSVEWKRDDNKTVFTFRFRAS